MPMFITNTKLQYKPKSSFHCTLPVRVAPGQYMTRFMRTDTDKYEHLKAAVLQCLCPDTVQKKIDLSLMRNCLGDACGRVKV